MFTIILNQIDETDLARVDGLPRGVSEPFRAVLVRPRPVGDRGRGRGGAVVGTPLGRRRGPTRSAPLAARLKDELVYCVPKWEKKFD